MLTILGKPGDSEECWFAVNYHRFDDFTEGICLTFIIGKHDFELTSETVIKNVKRFLSKCNYSWITPGNNEWEFNLDPVFDGDNVLKKQYRWSPGTVRLIPHVEIEEHCRNAGHVGYRYSTNLNFYLKERQFDMTKDSEPGYPPVEIQESLKRFLKDHHNHANCGFIMMPFGSSHPFPAIASKIKETLDRFGLEGLRADDKEYHNDLWYNVLTYLYGCSFGIGVFEHIAGEHFNPNVSLEIGYMQALKKPVCILKDHNFSILQSDLIGRLYKEFNPQDLETIQLSLSDWLEHQELRKVQ